MNSPKSCEQWREVKSLCATKFFSGGKPVSFIYDYGDKVTDNEEINIDGVLDEEGEAARLVAGHGEALR